ncbi:MAG: extracellular solute-binding protein, partial [Deltaproteobacteria bacterium]|nr:extracellular solute-binding protein [Deltaproteobacteria bacterium]
IDLKLNIKYVSGNDAFFPALRDGQADIISPSHNVPRDKRWKIMKLNMVLPLNLDNIPNYKNIIPALQKADYCTEGGKVYAVPHVRGPYGLAYNTTLVKEAPTSWNAFWEPQYKGKYVLGGAGQYEHNVSMTALAMGIAPEKIYDFKTINTPELQAKLADLAVNAQGMWVGVDDVKTLKGRSIAAVWGFSLPELKKMGETWKIAEPKEGTTGWVDNFMISNTLKDKPKLLKIAEEWLNFVLSDDYQVYDVRGLACAPVTTTVKAKLTAEEVAQFHLDDPGHFQKNRILWKVLGKQDRKGLKSLWDAALAKRK